MAKLVDLFLKGGPVMWPILGLSILGLAILIWKAFEFRAGRRTDKGLVVVSTIIAAEPMLGILGTVIGIMQTFGALNGTDGNPLAATVATDASVLTDTLDISNAVSLVGLRMGGTYYVRAFIDSDGDFKR